MHSFDSIYKSSGDRLLGAGIIKSYDDSLGGVLVSEALLRDGADMSATQ